MRINKFLAEQGVASRRGADELVAEGRVTINGRRAVPGDDVSPDDAVSLDGKLLSHKIKFEYYLLNKPKGCVCTVKDENAAKTDDRAPRKTVMDFLPANVGRVFPVGRLDYDSEGLLILTNDGDLAYRLTAPQSEIPKTYLVKVEGSLTAAQLNRLRTGVELGQGIITKKCRVVVTEENKGFTKLQMTLTEGKNREIRRMFEAIGKEVTLLKRVKLGELTLSGMDRGQCRKLTPEEVFYLKNL